MFNACSISGSRLKDREDSQRPKNTGAEENSELNGGGIRGKLGGNGGGIRGKLGGNGGGIRGKLGENGGGIRGKLGGNGGGIRRKLGGNGGGIRGKLGGNGGDKNSGEIVSYIILFNPKRTLECTKRKLRTFYS
ncbi:H/ACA ribonucleoprotein complex subunit 1-like [Hydra vulgaris]|uniref:H/ACA ribonucleoprotein complex subunit 1-like n=1 Tax=Hydra vulgaris TaxID=6087 RepID=UPI0006413608|nr:H/ACA ribonucleoprotein complex subunit 1-like [Hydra vulgaris]